MFQLAMHSATADLHCHLHTTNPVALHPIPLGLILVVAIPRFEPLLLSNLPPWMVCHNYNSCCSLLLSPGHHTVSLSETYRLHNRGLSLFMNAWMYKVGTGRNVICLPLSTSYFPFSASFLLCIRFSCVRSPEFLYGGCISAVGAKFQRVQSGGKKARGSKAEKWRSYDKTSGRATQRSGFVELRVHSKDEQASQTNPPS